MKTGGTGQLHEALLPAALGYADFFPTEGRVPFPDTCCDLAWVCDQVFITGPESRPVATTFPGERVRLLRLDPFVAREWLGMPLGPIANRQIALDDISRRLADQIRDLGNSNALLNLYDPAACRTRRPGVTRLTAAAAVLERTRSVRAAAIAADLSERQLARLFASELGLSPGKFAQVVRFRVAAQAARRGMSLAGAAALADYADQAHFTRETKALTGKTPRVFIEQHVGIVQDAEVGQF